MTHLFFFLNLSLLTSLYKKKKRLETIFLWNTSSTLNDLCHGEVHIFFLGQSWAKIKAKVAFHLSELTSQTIPVATIISVLIKTLQPDPSNPKIACTKDNVSQQKLFEKAISFSNWLVGQWSGRPVLTNGKRPKYSQSPFAILETPKTYLWFYRKENKVLHSVPIIGHFWKTQEFKLKKLDQFFKVTIHFHLGHW